MGRKNLLEGLLGSAAIEEAVPPRAGAGVNAKDLPLTGHGSRGAIGAVARSIEHVKDNAVRDIDTSLIDPSLISDRLGGSSEAHDALVASIREHGQQVPILVRPHPEREGRYQIAYGRRRLRALATLGRKVRAVVKPLTDQELVVAQGQENSARTDLSFIEKALFAARLEESGYDRETIMAALSVDKTGLSRLISSAVKIPRDLIEAIGPAPKAGRDRWIELSLRLASGEAVQRARDAAGAEAFAAKSSDDRFNAIFAAAAVTKPTAIRRDICRAGDGTAIARVKQDANSLTVAIDKTLAPEFGAYLIQALPDLYAAFKRRDEQKNTS